MSDRAVQLYPDRNEFGEKSMQPYQRAWMAHWMRPSCGSTGAAHDQLSLGCESREEKHCTKHQPAPSGKEYREAGKGKMIGFVNESLAISSGKRRDDAFEEPASVIFKLPQNRKSVLALEKGESSRCRQDIPRPHVGPNFGYDDSLDGIQNSSFSMFALPPSEAEIPSRSFCFQPEGISLTPELPVKSDKLIGKNTLAVLPYFQNDNLGLTSKIVAYQANGRRTPMHPFFCHQSNNPSGATSVAHQKKMDTSAASLVHDPSTDTDQLRNFIRRPFQKMPKHSDVEPFPSWIGRPDTRNLRNPHNGSYAPTWIPPSVHDVETMGICATIDTVEKYPKVPQKFSQTTHQFFFTRKTGVNLLDGSQMFRESLCASEGKKVNEFPCLSPNFTFHIKQGSKLQPLGSFIESAGRENTEHVKTSTFDLNNESSAETETMDMDFFRKNHLFGVGSSQSNKDIKVIQPKKVFFKPIHKKLEKSTRNTPPCAYPRHSGKKFTSRNAPKSKFSSVLGSGSSRGSKLKLGIGEPKQVVVDRISDFDRSNLTPLSKVAGGSALNLAIDGGALAQHGGEISNTDRNTNSASNNTKTPPVQASVSPEIQCGSTLVSTTTETSTPACYAAGHVLSGIIDKRKCRPRGLLTVGEAKALGNFDSDEGIDQDNAFGLANNCSISMLPLPAEASMHWLLSPCNEGDGDQKENLEESYYPQILEEHNALNCPAPSPSYSSGPSLYLCNSIAKEEDRKSHYDLDGKNSPFSTSSVDNENVVQTPQSDSSSERRVARSLLREIDRELHSVAEHLRMASLSLWSYASIWDPRSSNFQFECLPTPSNSVDLSQFQKVLDDRGSRLPNSTLEDVSQSQMRVSWRGGLVSRIFEMDEIDYCRCLSDEEDNATCYKTNPSKPAQSPELDVNMKSDQIHSCSFGSTEFLIHRNAKEETPSQEPCSRAESISADGDGLARSEDSGWTLCYKNQLFKV